MTTPAIPVYQTLTQSRAELERSSPLGDGMTAALWRRVHLEDTYYNRPDHHTVSLYLEGGFEIVRRDRPQCHGAPGKLCLLPADHESDWRVMGPIRFLHLYFPTEQFDALAVTLLDREPREMRLLDRTYMDDPVLAGLCRRLALLDWQTAEGRLTGNALSHEALAHLMLSHTERPQSLSVKGGLAPWQRRRVAELVEARLDGELTVGELAAELALSEYHFARMFRASFGQPPHSWIMQRRLIRAQELLRSSRLPLADIAAASGFASASHFANRFRRTLGATPGQYRRWLGRTT